MRRSKTHVKRGRRTKLISFIFVFFLALSVLLYLLFSSSERRAPTQKTPSVPHHSSTNAALLNQSTERSTFLPPSPSARRTSLSAAPTPSVLFYEPRAFHTTSVRPTANTSTFPADSPLPKSNPPPPLLDKNSTLESQASEKTDEKEGEPTTGQNDTGNRHAYSTAPAYLFEDVDSHTPDPNVSHNLWCDDEFPDAPPTLEDYKAMGVVHLHTLPYPSEVEDNATMREYERTSEVYLDKTAYISREDLLHFPTVFDNGLESFADLRLTSLTHTGVHIHSEERKALRKHQEDTKNENKARDTAFHLTPEEVLVDDHSIHSRYFTHEYRNALVNEPYRSTPTASAPRHPSLPHNEVLTRLIQGDAMFDALGYQILDRHFIVERAMSTVFRNRFCDRFVELMHLPNRPPLVVHLHKLQVFAFVVRCLYFRAHALTTAKRKFVLLGTEVDETAGKTFYWEIDLHPPDYPNANITYVLNHPLLAHWYSMNGNIRHPKFSAIPIGLQFYTRDGSLASVTAEYRLIDQMVQINSTTSLLYGLHLDKMFPHSTSHPLQFGALTTMWLERALEVLVGSTVKSPVKIIPLDQLPERITTFYVVLMPIERYKRADRPSLTDDVIIFEEPSEANHHRTASVQHIALLPFTVALYQKWQQLLFGNHEGGGKLFLPARKIVTAFTSWEWREGWYKWLKETGIGSIIPWGPENFFRWVGQYSFVASPLGYGYECFRSWEALIAGGVPILQNPVLLENKIFVLGMQEELSYKPEVNSFALLEPYRDLPVIFVDHYKEMTLENLLKWQKEIYSRAKRGDYKLEKLFMQYWIDRIYGHSNHDD